MTETDPLDTDGLARLLDPHRRRELLRYLRSHCGGEVYLADLTDGVRQRCREERLSETRLETRIQLLHIDLPKLEDAGVLEYDQSTHRVVYEGREDVDAMLDSLATRAD